MTKVMMGSFTMEGGKEAKKRWPCPPQGGRDEEDRKTVHAAVAVPLNHLSGMPLAIWLICLYKSISSLKGQPSALTPRQLIRLIIYSVGAVDISRWPERGPISTHTPGDSLHRHNEHLPVADMGCDEISRPPR